MKRLLLFTFGLLIPLFAMSQEEDVTHYIQNAGFDSDLTWQPNGDKKMIIQQQALGARSIAGIAADSSVYALVNPSTSQHRSDGRTLEATNGFIGRIQGWQIETNQNFPQCEWVYFGSIPYSLDPTAIPISDDGSTYLTVPSKPEGFTSEDNVGFAYLRAGWGGRAVYKQVVELPCAKYRLEYWAVNLNPYASKGKNLSEVICRKDHFKDETGFNDAEWTKHSIEFTATSKFTIEFGFESEGGSGSNPFLCIDGIKLYKTGEAQPEELLYSLAEDCNELVIEAQKAGYMALAKYIYNYETELEGLIGKSKEEMMAALSVSDMKIETIRAAIFEMPKVDAIIEKIEFLLQNTNYAGKTDLESVHDRILSYKQNEDYESGTDVPTLILGAVAEGTAAVFAYMMTQEASEESPADYTFWVKHPWFIDVDAEPVWKDDKWFFPKRYDSKTGADLYVEGSASSPNLNSEGWVITGISGGVQCLNWVKQRSCWRAWASGFTGVISVGQTIENLPNGYYMVAADLITQYVSDQHVYVKSSVERKISTQTLTEAGWNKGKWETVSMTKEEKVLVVDGKLTIGAEGTGTGEGATGWFCATNFKLYYLGKASQYEIKSAFYNKVNEATAFVAQMHFSADRKALNDTIAKYKYTHEESEYSRAITIIDMALDIARKSENKYFEYSSILNEVCDILQGLGYGVAQDVMQFAYDYITCWIESENATYTDFDDIVDLLRNYKYIYTPVVIEISNKATEMHNNARNYLESIINRQLAYLISEMKDKATVDSYVAELNSAFLKATKQEIYENTTATDYTAFIINPNLEAESGWTFERGNTNINTYGGQWYNSYQTRYIDPYNANLLIGFRAYQLIKDLPNGTYQVGVFTRTTAEGAYLFQKASSDTLFTEIPVNYYTTKNNEVVLASDIYGPIWEEAMAAVDAGTATEDQYVIAEMNNGKGLGWQLQYLSDIVVDNHELLIGTMTGTESSATPKTFAGEWYSVGGWTLTLKALGNNDGWIGPCEFDYIRGDANADSRVSMGDPVTIVNYLLSKNPQPFSYRNANVNMDESISITDVVGVVNIILGIDVAEARSSENNPVGRLDIVQSDGELNIMLENAATYTAFQMDITLPEGVTIQKALFTNRATKSHSLSYEQIDNCKYRLIGWSPQNATFKGNSGALFNLTLDGTDTPIIIDNILFTTSEGTEHHLDAIDYDEGVTNIISVSTDNNLIRYDLQGRKLDRNIKGLQIVNGKICFVK